VNPSVLRPHLEVLRRHPGDDARLAAEAVKLAGTLLADARRNSRPDELGQALQLARLLEDPAGKDFIVALADRVLRAPTAARQAALFRQLVGSAGPPRGFSPLDRAALRLAAAVSPLAPGLVMALVARTLRHRSGAVILPAEPDALAPLLARRRAEGFRMNLNLLGEAVLGEDEAERRLRALLDRLASPDCDCLSVKLSSIHSQIHPVGEAETLVAVTARLRRLYRAALDHPGEDGPKLVNLDMEEYRDLALTRAAFQQVLDEPEFLRLEAGIALQAYLPDAWPVQREFIAWAKRRIARGGASIRIRLVKGANLAMEKVDAELNGWPAAPYATKEETDANFKRMLHEACRPENAAAVRHGVASHNLFDLAYALLLRAREGVEDRVGFEMLEGMASHQARAVKDAAGGLLLYAPVVRREDFTSAIAYLVRRLDENTSPKNFLRDLFSLAPGTAAWERQETRFLRACARRDEPATAPNRRQDRQSEIISPDPAGSPFHNAANTDFSLAANRRWIHAALEAFRAAPPRDVSPVVAGREEPGEHPQTGRDPSRPGTASYRFTLAGPDRIERALQAAVAARDGWRALGHDGRAALLRRAAAELANARGEAIAAMVCDAGKAVTEADAEVSEAVDFANYYARAFSGEEFGDGVVFEPFGTVLVAPPWNFPFAIPCGGVLAALAGGNTVILKPARETVLTARVMAGCLWRAGIPQDVLQFLPCASDANGRALVTDDRIGAVILTGAYETARTFLGWKPSLRLFAETSGKNALLISAAADADLAIKDLVKSAFGHAGQKCSAASLAIVEAGLYDHPSFLRQLRDAAASLRVAGAWRGDAVVTPLIHEPGDALHRALTTLDPGERWLLEPRNVDGNPCLWSPGIKLGVDPAGWFRRTECFGPVLGVIRADDFDHALRLQNDSDFGLTAGLHSLDDREIARWRERIEAGNAYVNRGITGAIVRRQPFGGWKDSCFGPGAKAGGPNYCQLFGTWRETSPPRLTARPSPAPAALLARLASLLPGDARWLAAAAGSDAYWNAREFSVEHDPSGLLCESNVFRYRKFARSLLRAGETTTDAEIARLLLAATAMELPFELSLANERPWLNEQLGISAVTEADDAFAARLAHGDGRNGLCRAPHGGIGIKAAALAAGWRWADGPVLSNARIEWPAWLREQCLSETRHRHGNRLPERAEWKE